MGKHDYLVSFKEDGEVDIRGVNFITREAFEVDEHAFLKKLNLYKGFVPKGKPPAFVVSDRKGMRSIAVDEVFYLKSQDKYTVIRTVNKSDLLQLSLVELEEQLRVVGFVRANRNALVNMNYVRAIDHFHSASGTQQSIVRFHVIDDEIIVSRRSTALMHDAFRERAFLDYRRRAFVR